MGEGNHLPVPTSAGQPKGRWVWLLGGTVVAVLATGMLMQFIRGPQSQAAADPPAAGQARVGKGETKQPEVLAKVGKDTINYDTVAQECVRRHGKEVLDDLIHRLMIQQACEKNNVTVSDKEISDEIERFAKKFNLDVNQWLQMVQAERNISPMQYRQSIIFPMLALKKIAGDEVEVTEKDIKEGFIRNYGPRVKARMIMFDNIRRAQEKIDEIEKNPEDFEKMAASFSIDPNSRSLGGQIPPIPMHNGNPELENAAFRLKKGQISGIIEVAPSRYVILKCEGRTEPVVSNIEEVRDQLFEELKESKTQAEIAKIFEVIKNNTVVDNYLTGTSTRPDSKAAGPGQGSNIQPTSGTQSKSGAAPKTSNSSKANRN